MYKFGILVGKIRGRHTRGMNGRGRQANRACRDSRFPIWMDEAGRYVAGTYVASRHVAGRQTGHSSICL